jgi:hypothetical protein
LQFERAPRRGLLLGLVTALVFHFAAVEAYARCWHDPANGPSR